MRNDEVCRFHTAFGSALGRELLLRNEGCHGIAVGNFECHLLYIIAS